MPVPVERVHKTEGKLNFYYELRNKVFFSSSSAMALESIIRFEFRFSPIAAIFQLQICREILSLKRKQWQHRI